MHGFNFSTQEAEAGETLEYEISLVKQCYTVRPCLKTKQNETNHQKINPKVSLNASSSCLWKPRPSETRRHSKPLSPRQRKASWERVRRRRPVPLGLRPDVLPGATLHAQPSQYPLFPTLSLPKCVPICRDSGISSFFFRQAEVPPAIDTAPVSPFAA